MDIDTPDNDMHACATVLARLFDRYIDVTLKSNPFKTRDGYVGHIFSILVYNPFVQQEIRGLLRGNNSMDKGVSPPAISGITEV